MHRIRTQCASVWILIFFVAVLLVPPTANGQDDGKAVVKVMTYNVNEGTDFIEVLSATNFPDFQEAVAVTLRNIDSTKPPLRMQAVAREIAQTQPDLVGLQEVTTWSVNGQERYNMLGDLLTALHDLGSDYNKVVEVQEFQLQGVTPDFTVVQGVNHDVILARADPDMELSNVRQASFSDSILLHIPTVLGTFTIIRGWGSVDVTLHGQSFRFVVSHLEQYLPVALPLQEAQALELAAAATAGTSDPVIIAVDANADALGVDPSIATYQLIRSLGFGDAWAAVHPNEPGATWGSMEDPNDPRPPVHQRIDYIFFKDGVRALNAQLAGQRTQEKMDGLWPSDHTGVRATLLSSWE